MNITSFRAFVRFRLFVSFFAALLLVSICSVAYAADPLPSWNEGPAKKSILEFVAAVTDKNSKDYVAPAERIATFDNDGTLWSEKPLYFQLLFAMDRVKEVAADHPETALYLMEILVLALPKYRP